MFLSRNKKNYPQYPLLSGALVWILFWWESLIFSFATSKIGFNSERKEFAPLRAVFSFKSRPHFRKVKLAREADRMSLKLFPF